MAEFLAIHQSDARLLGCLLRRLAGSVTLGSAEPAAGVGFFQSNDVLLRKRPQSGPASAEKLAEGIESEAVLISSGVAAAGERGFHEETALPFRYKRWLFSFAGQPDALAPCRPALAAGLPDSLRRGARSETAVELLFFSFLSKLREAGRLDDFDLDSAVAARALASAVGQAERACEQLGIPLPALSVVATNGRVLTALRRGHPLWVWEREGVGSCARCELDESASKLDPALRAHLAQKAVIVGSGPLPATQAPEAAGLREVNEAEILGVSRSLRVAAL